MPGTRRLMQLSKIPRESASLWRRKNTMRTWTRTKSRMKKSERNANRRRIGRKSGSVSMTWHPSAIR